MINPIKLKKALKRKTARASQNSSLNQQKKQNENSDSSSSNDEQSDDHVSKLSYYHNCKTTRQNNNNNNNNNQNSQAITFDRLREKIYSEVAHFISQNESRPVYLLNLFKQLKGLNDNKSRYEALKYLYDMNNVATKSESASSSSSSSEHLEKKFLAKKTEMTNTTITTNDEFDVNEPESDSLSNTVIFVQSKQPIDNTKNNLSSDLIKFEVQQMISRVINTLNESEKQDSRLFDTIYIRELTDRALNSLRESSCEQKNYLRLYENQLRSYIEDALKKFISKRVCDCIEDVLCELRDILCSELTFYAIMAQKTDSEFKQIVLVEDKSSKMNRNESTVTHCGSSTTTTNDSSSSSSEEDEKEGKESVRFQIEEIRTQNREFDKNKFKGVELLKQLNSILSEKMDEINKIKEKTSEFSDLFEDKNEIELEGESSTSKTSSINDLSNPITYKVMDVNDLEESKDTLNKFDLAGLDKIIMDSISDDLVGDANEMPKINNIVSGNRAELENEEAEENFELLNEDEKLALKSVSSDRSTTASSNASSSSSGCEETIISKYDCDDGEQEANSVVKDLINELSYQVEEKNTYDHL